MNEDVHEFIRQQMDIFDNLPPDVRKFMRECNNYIDSNYKYIEMCKTESGKRVLLNYLTRASASAATAQSTCCE